MAERMTVQCDPTVDALGTRSSGSGAPAYPHIHRRSRSFTAEHRYKIMLTTGNGKTLAVRSKKDNS